MGLNKKNLLVTVLGLSFSAFTYAEMGRQSCPEAPQVVGHTNAPLESFQSFLDENNIRIVSPRMRVHHLENFIFEYKKIPDSIRERMVNGFSSIHIMDGGLNQYGYETGNVTMDPTWKDSSVKTFDNRNWSYIPGAGGSPYVTKNQVDYILQMQKYCKQKGVSCEKEWTFENLPSHPTRVVVNRLYPERKKAARNVDYYNTFEPNHGSNNLVLHEHAHSLDSLTEHNGISSSEKWKDLMRNPMNEAFVQKICKKENYCLSNDHEAFAELFAYYYNCEATRHHTEMEAPEIAQFMKNLSKMKDSKKVFKGRNEIKISEHTYEQHEQEHEQEEALADLPEEIEEEVEEKAEEKSKKKFKFPKIKFPKIKLPKVNLDKIF